MSQAEAARQAAVVRVPGGEFEKSCGEADSDAVALCIEPGKDSVAARRELEQMTGQQTDSDGEVTPQALPWPEWCYDHIFDGWWTDRGNACKSANLHVVLVDVRTGRVLGTADYTVATWAHVVENYRGYGTWMHELTLELYRSTGLGNSLMVAGRGICGGQYCRLIGTDFPAQSASSGNEPSGFAAFDVPTDKGQIRRASSTIELNFWHGPNQGTPTGATTPQIRCDKALGGNYAAGCVYPYNRPTTWYRVSGQHPQFATHVQFAQDSGLPGAPTDPPLTRLTNKALKAKNYRTACKDSYTRPPGHSCDEYPFEGSYQGAYTGGGDPRSFDFCDIPQVGRHTGPNGYSVCMIDEGDNSGAGSDVARFYRRYRILDGDKFSVWIKP